MVEKLVDDAVLGRVLEVLERVLDHEGARLMTCKCRPLTLQGFIDAETRTLTALGKQNELANLQGKNGRSGLGPR